MLSSETLLNTQISFEDFKKEVLADYVLAFESRQASLIGRKEVLTGKAKFGIFGDGKEIAQIAMAKAFKNGDIRSGYYRDQTFMFAIGKSSIKEFFAQLYAHTDLNAEPASAGRLMNGHFATRFLDNQGNFKPLKNEKHSTGDISPTAGQMGRALGIAYASKLYRNAPTLQHENPFSNNGNEVSFCTIGNASASEGHFWETVNAAGVLQVPLAISIWDDGYGISVPAKYQTTKENIGEILAGFQSTETHKGYEIYTCNGWDYAALCEMYTNGIEKVRNTHTPAIFHIKELTQPQGHSTSGSHERYKTPERLQWEKEFDCIAKMRAWLLENQIADESTLEAEEQAAIARVLEWKQEAWNAYRAPIAEEIKTGITLLEAVYNATNIALITNEVNQLQNTKDAIRKDLMVAVRKSLWACKGINNDAITALNNWKLKQEQLYNDLYSSHLYSASSQAVHHIPNVAPQFSVDSKEMNGYEILNHCFDSILERYPNFFAIGEDVGKIGDVNQGFMNLQAKYGEIRVTDTGIREMTIVGQGLGAAMRGLKPLVEIQYLDYLLYALQIMSDDIATLQYRTKGGQKAPLIIRTRGHRLEGIWHSGSPIGMILNAVRGMHVLVPRNMVQAAGFYNLLLRSDEPALVIECLNGYRLKETLPDNYTEFTVPLGEPEILVQGTDITLVTYGSCCRIAVKAAEYLKGMGIAVEVIDCQTLLPFDIKGAIVASLKKTNRLLVLDEDVKGGASAYILQQILENQDGWRWLDSKPETLTAKDHRPAYGTDGDYFSKPSEEDVVEAIYKKMLESDPSTFHGF